MYFLKLKGLLIQDSLGDLFHNGLKLMTKNKKDRFLLFADWQPKGEVGSTVGQTAVDFLRTVLSNMKNKHISSFKGKTTILFAGDVVDRAYGRDYNYSISGTEKAYYTHKDAHEDLMKLNAHEVFVTSGNHDIDGRSYFKGDDSLYAHTFKTHEEWFGERTYHVYKGNILFIFLGQNIDNVGGVYSNEAFEYWKDLVIKNKDKNIFTITHHPLYDVPSGNTESYDTKHNYWWYIGNSKRFIDVLESLGSDSNHIAWLYGHIGRARYTLSKYNTHHFNGGMHLGKPKTSYLTYWVFDIEDGNKDVTFKLWEYHDQTFKESIDITLKYPYIQGESIDSRICNKVGGDKIPKLLYNQAVKTLKGKVNKIDWVDRGTRDQEGGNLEAGHGFGYRINLAGGNSSVPKGEVASGIDGNYFETTNGISGGIAWVRTSGVEDNFSAKLKLYAGYKGSLVNGLTIDPDGTVTFGKDSNRTEIKSNQLTFFALDKSTVFNMGDNASAWELFMRDSNGSKIKESVLKYVDTSKKLFFGNKEISTHTDNEKITTLPNALVNANILGDTNATISSVSINKNKIGVRTFLNITIKIDGFSATIPNDDGFIFDLDLSSILDSPIESVGNGSYSLSGGSLYVCSVNMLTNGKLNFKSNKIDSNSSVSVTELDIQATIIV